MAPVSEPLEVDKKNNAQEKSGSLGTFAGVFTPSILTILGIILFLRLGYVTGSGGVRRAFIIIAVANVITRTELWANASIRLLTVEEAADPSKSIEQLEQQLDDVRIPAEPVLVSGTQPETVVAESSSSTIVFLPFRIQRSMLTDTQGYSLERVLTRLPPAALVMAAKDIDLDAEPEEGGAGELAKAMDNLHEVEKRAGKVEKQYKKHQQLVTTLEEKFDKKSASLDETALKEFNKQLTEAKETAEKYFRKAAKERAKLDDALALVKQLSEDDV